jgi:prefoldin beta subunit
MDEQKLQEMQILEQKLQNTILQKQAFQMELAETDAAFVELEKAGDEVFKIIGQLMLKSDKSKIKEELIDKQKMLQLRISTFEKQEKFLTEQLEKFREDISKN